jgi:hypothetical protein
MKKITSIFFTLILLTTNIIVATPSAYSQDDATRDAIENEIQKPPNSILPRITNPNLKSNYICTLLIQEFEEIYFFTLDSEDFNSNQGSVNRFTESVLQLNQGSVVDGAIGSNDVLGCAIMTGRIKMAYLSIFIFYVLRLATVSASSVSIIFIMIGGYKYIIGAITENKDEGKRTIIYAIVGLVVSTLAWVIVNIVQTLVTS